MAGGSVGFEVEVVQYLSLELFQLSPADDADLVALQKTMQDLAHLCR